MAYRREHRQIPAAWPDLARTLALSALLGLAMFAAPACGGGPGALGASCGSDSQCESGFCYSAQCMDPDADTDSDGLGNLQESQLGTDPLAADSDGDGLPDDVEIGDDPVSPRDADGDGGGDDLLHDANESAIADSDGDCIADQFDPANDERETDMAVLAALACRNEGVCGADDATVAATCDGQLECDYSGVPAWDGELEVTCDGLDNDCDGEVDEGLVWTDAKGAVLTVGSACEGVSGCEARTGVVECGADGQTLCSADPGGSDFEAVFSEIPCNGLDDDCDGITDNGAALEAEDGTLQNVGDECFAAGLCGNIAGVVECSAAADGTALCSTGPGGSNDQSAVETCDAADNDCDGEVDEGLTWQDPSGVDVPLGEACGLGACEGASVRCRAGTPVCCRLTDAGECDDIEALAQQETCDSVDNDCDGATDEAEDVVALCDAPGVCAELAPASGHCDEDGLLVCSWEGVAGYEAVETSCNGADDDCDGSVDEDLATADGLELGSACSGVGACSQQGEVICDPSPGAGGAPGAICSADLDGTEEVCNGIDDDCDGEVDEDVDVSGVEGADDLVCAELGICAAFIDQPPVCVEGEVACAAAANVFFESNETQCDTQDNDCDGLVDEGTPKLFTANLDSLSEGQPAHRAHWRAAQAGDGTLWVFGGRQGEVGPLLGDLWRFDPTTNDWQRIDGAGSPVARAWHATTWDPEHGVLLVHGGASTTTGAEPLSGLFAYSPSEEAWQPVSQTGLVPTDGDVAELPARHSHSLTALGGGELLLHGGLASDGLPHTLIGTLEESDGQLSCVWAEAPVQAAQRSAHVAVLWGAGAPRVALVGGAGEGAQSAFAESLELDGGQAWMGLGDTKEQPAPRTGHLLLAQGDRLLALGGRTVAAEGAEPTPTGDAWGYDLAAPGAAWESVEAPASLVSLAGAFGWADDEGLHVAGGRGEVDATWRASARLPAGAEEWEVPTPWEGPEPRVGGVLAVRPDTGETWLVGGSRTSGAYPLMDVWRRDDGAAWEPILAPVAPSAGPFGQTRPATEGAAAAWDPVNERLLIYGGWDVGAGEPSDQLWAFDPASESFGLPDVQGAPEELPGPTTRAVLGVDKTGGEAWLLGSYAVDGPEGSEHVLAVHRLDLSNTTWTLAWTGEPGEPGPVRYLMGGVGSAGLRAVSQAQGSKSLQMWAWDSEAEALMAAGEPTAPVFDDVLGGAYDRWSDRSAAIVDSNGLGGVHLVQLVHATGTVPGPLPASALDVGLTGSAWVVHPWLGLVGFGGSVEGGAGLGASLTVAQKCAPP